MYHIRVFVSCILPRVYIFWQRSSHTQLSYNLDKDNKVSYQLRLILLWWVKDCPKRVVGWTVCLEQKLAPCLFPKDTFSYFCMGDGNKDKDNKVSYKLRLILLWWVKDCRRRVVGWIVCLEQKLATCLLPKETFSYFCMGDGMFKTYLKNCSCGLLVMDFTYIVACIDVVIKLPCYFQEKRTKKTKTK